MHRKHTNLSLCTYNCPLALALPYSYPCPSTLALLPIPLKLVYSALEDAVDYISTAAKHQAYVFESGGTNVKKMLSLMVRPLPDPYSICCLKPCV